MQEILLYMTAIGTQTCQKCANLFLKQFKIYSVESKFSEKKEKRKILIFEKKILNFLFNFEDVFYVRFSELNHAYNDLKRKSINI